MKKLLLSVMFIGSCASVAFGGDNASADLPESIKNLPAEERDFLKKMYQAICCSMLRAENHPAYNQLPECTSLEFKPYFLKKMYQAICCSMLRAENHPAYNQLPECTSLEFKPFRDYLDSLMAIKCKENCSELEALEKGKQDAEFEAKRIQSEVIIKRENSIRREHNISNKDCAAYADYIMLQLVASVNQPMPVARFRANE